MPAPERPGASQPARTPVPHGAPHSGSPRHREPIRRSMQRMIVRKPLTIGRAARIISTFTLLMTVVGGVVIHLADKQNFPDIGDGLWWSVQTVTTVGYGDHVPTNAVGRTVAAIVMLAGIGFLTVITATITSAFVESARRRMEGVELNTLDAKLDALGTRLDAIEAGLARERPG
jgi:voltage-gated potassium channel